MGAYLKFTNVISLLEWPSFCSHGGVQGKHYNLVGFASS